MFGVAQQIALKSERWFVRGLHRGLMFGNSGVGATARCGEGVGVNSGGGGLQPKNRPSHHKYKSPKQFELRQS